MGSFIETIQKRKLLPAAPYSDDLPVSQSDTLVIGLRRRISSFSVRIQPSSTASFAWAFRKSKSMSSLGEFAGGPLRRWWEWSWGWILSRKPASAKDVEMNEEESAMLGRHRRGSLRHVFCKAKSEITKRVRSSQTLPTTQRFRYDSFSYAQNFDGGKGAEE